MVIAGNETKRQIKALLWCACVFILLFECLSMTEESVFCLRIHTCQPFVRKPHFDLCCAAVYLFSSSGQTLSHVFSQTARCQSEAQAARQRNLAYEDSDRLTGRETEASLRRWRSQERWCARIHQCLSAAERACACVCQIVSLYACMFVLSPRGWQQREDGSGTDHQPPGQSLETDSQLMEITQTHTLRA